MTKVIFYHAGCPVCVSAEQDVLQLLDHSRCSLKLVHLGEQPSRMEEAEQAGVQSIPALLLENGSVIHLNFGASLAEVKASLLTA